MKNKFDVDFIDKETKNLVSLRVSFVRALKYESINFKALLDIHKNLFDGIFPFAGKIRDVNIGKGDTIFCLYQYLNEELDLFFKDFSKENELKGLDRERFCKRASCYYGDLNMIHPFREGNGRAIRELFFQIGKNAGYLLDLTKCDKKVYLDAVIASINRSDDLNKLMLSIVKPLSKSNYALNITETAINNKKIYQNIEKYDKLFSNIIQEKRSQLENLRKHILEKISVTEKRLEILQDNEPGVISKLIGSKSYKQWKNDTNRCTHRIDVLNIRLSRINEISSTDIIKLAHAKITFLHPQLCQDAKQEKELLEKEKNSQYVKNENHDNKRSFHR